MLAVPVLALCACGTRPATTTAATGAATTEADPEGRNPMTDSPDAAARDGDGPRRRASAVCDEPLRPARGERPDGRGFAAREASPRAATGTHSTSPGSSLNTQTTTTTATSSTGEPEHRCCQRSPASATHGQSSTQSAKTRSNGPQTRPARDGYAAPGPSVASRPELVHLDVKRIGHIAAHACMSVRLRLGRAACENARPRQSA